MIFNKILKHLLLPVAITGMAAPATGYAQNGCTDPAAINYSAAAMVNDGSCNYAVTHYNPVTRAAFGSGIAESSGLVFTDGKLWTHNDSGNPNYIFSIDTTTGAILQTVYIDNFANTDWEAITADSAFIYVGNFGNNNGNRQDLSILKIAKADIASAPVVHVNAQAIAFSYADQTVFNVSAHNFDCESMISVRDSLYLFTKDRGDAQTRVYKLPKTPGTYTVSPYTGYNIGGLVTDASYNPVTKEIVLIGYLSGHFNSFLWFLSDYKGVNFFSGNKRRVEITNGVEWQTEGACWLSNNRFFISCEKTNSIPSTLYVCDTNLHVSPPATAVATVLPGVNIVIAPNPAGSSLYISGVSASSAYNITDMTGRVVLQGRLQAGSSTVDVAKLPSGNYAIAVKDLDGRVVGQSKFVKQ